MKTFPRVAVLGAGIMGASTALRLARRGSSVSLFDIEDQPFSCASRWNEGRIHLGFLYANDGSLETARRILPGGLSFHRDVEDLLGSSLQDLITPSDDIYLIHKDSVVSADLASDYFQSVMQLARDHPDASHYMADLQRTRVHRLTRDELARLADTDSIVAGFRIPERSVSTTDIADLYVAALMSQPRIEQHLSTRVIAVEPQQFGEWAGPWSIETVQGRHGPFDAVVNALWQGRLVIDRTLGILPKAAWSHRYRLAVFARTRESIEVPSIVVTIGPYGDIKYYGERRLYMSWYPIGLMAEGSAVPPPQLFAFDDAAKRKIFAGVVSELGRLLPQVRQITFSDEDVRVEGGWVFAMGTGSLSDPSATLHQRHRVGIHRHGTYFSVDTGKYSIAPWLSRQVATALLGE